MVRPNGKSWDPGIAGLEDKEFGEEEAQVGKPKTAGYKPSPAEVEEHNLTHLPFRNWCEACVRGKAKDEPHRQGDGTQSGVPF